MSNKLIDNQRDFEDAIMSGSDLSIDVVDLNSVSSADIKLAAGHYTLPEDWMLEFNGSITGCGEKPDDVVIKGSINTRTHLVLKNLTINTGVYHSVNEVDEDVITVETYDFSHHPQIILQNVNIIQSSGDSDTCYLSCEAGTKLIADNVKASGLWGVINCMGSNVQVIFTNCALQSLVLNGNGCNAVLNNVSLGGLFVDGWNIATTNLNLFDHPQINSYIGYGEDTKYEQLKNRKWLFYINNGTFFARNLKLPDKLASGVYPILVNGQGRVIGNIVDSDQRTYQPTVDIMDDDSQVHLAGANNVMLLRKVKSNSHDAMKELQQLIGLTTVKKQVNQFIQIALMNKRRKQAGMSTVSNSFHSLFEGNPGTGKTTVARIVGKLMYEEGLLPTSNYVEVDRGDLVAGYVGQTAEKTTEVLKKATGGVLFIDEAYDLVHDSRDSFGLEALDTIMKYMEDHRDNLMIIFAGYTEDMQKLLKQNPGMKSRVPNFFTFEDYSAEEIAEIGQFQLRNKQMQFDQPNTEKLYKQLIQERYLNSNDHSNGRWIRNQNDLLLRQIAMAMSQDPNHPLDKILADDVTNAFGNVGNEGTTKGQANN